MLKLKLDEVKPLNLELTFESPNIILAKTQKKEATPTKEQQNITPDKGFDGLSEVTIYPISDEYIIPTGELEITENGEYDVKDKASAKVDIPEPTGTLEINANGVYNVKDKEFADVNVPEKKLGTKSITANGIYKASDDGLDGYSQVDVETSGVDINDYFNVTINNQSKNDFLNKHYIKKLPKVTADTSVVTLLSAFEGWSLTIAPEIDLANVVNVAYLFQDAVNLVSTPEYDLKNITQMDGLFSNCQSLEVANIKNTSNVTSAQITFNSCNALVTVPELNLENCQNVRLMFNQCRNLTNLGGLVDLGKAFLTTASENYTNYTVTLSSSYKLTHESLMNVINSVYDIKSIGVKPQKIILGGTNFAKLTEEEIKIATDKGWTVVAS